MRLSTKLLHSVRMWPTVRTWRQRFAQLNLNAILWVSRILGLTPFVYTKSRRRLRLSFWLIARGLVFHSAFILCTMTFRTHADGKALNEIHSRNPLAKQVRLLQDLLLISTFCVTLCRNFWVSRELVKLLNILMRLHRRYLQQYEDKSLDCRSFDRHLIYKSLSVWLELISMLAIFFGFTISDRYQVVLGIVGSIFSQTSVLLLSTHFHLAVLHIYRSIWLINRELLRLAHQLRMEETGNSTRVRELFWLYGRLMKHGIRLASLYDWQMLLFMMSLLSVNIITIFYLIVFIISLNHSVSTLLALNIIQALGINIIDFWLSIAVCELAERAGRGTLAILRLFNDTPNLDSELERSITCFALFLSHKRLRFSHCGLFHVNNAMGFRMMVACVLYILYLVQFDYWNL